MNLQDTIQPKSDQLNYDDLLAGPVTVRIAAVKRGNEEQPVQIDIEGHRPYRPCKSMRRVLVAAWGADGHQWVGRRMTLYGDPAVKWGGVAVGGIRISHLSHIPSRLVISLTVTRKQRSPYTVDPLPDEPQQQHPAPVDLPALIRVPADILVGYLNSLPNGSFACRSLSDLTPAQVARIAADPDKIRGLVNAWADSQETQQ